MPSSKNWVAFQEVLREGPEAAADWQLREPFNFAVLPPTDQEREKVDAGFVDQIKLLAQEFVKRNNYLHAVLYVGHYTQEYDWCRELLRTMLHRRDLANLLRARSAGYSDPVMAGALCELTEAELVDQAVQGSAAGEVKLSALQEWLLKAVVKSSEWPKGLHAALLRQAANEATLESPELAVLLSEKLDPDYAQEVLGTDRMPSKLLESFGERDPSRCLSLLNRVQKRRESQRKQQVKGAKTATDTRPPILPEGFEIVLGMRLIKALVEGRVTRDRLKEAATMADRIGIRGCSELEDKLAAAGEWELFINLFRGRFPEEKAALQRVFDSAGGDVARQMYARSVNAYFALSLAHKSFNHRLMCKEVSVLHVDWLPARYLRTRDLNCVVMLVHSFIDLAPFAALVRGWKGQRVVISVDAETQPFFGGGTRQPPCLLQLSDGKHVVLLDLLRLSQDQLALPGVDGLVAEVLASPNILKTGCGIKSDLLELRKLPHWTCFRGSVEGVVDCLHLFQRCCPWRGFGDAGVAKTVAFGIHVSLDKRCQTSDWGKRPLSDEQLEYAALDVAAVPHALCGCLKVAADAGYIDQSLLPEYTFGLPAGDVDHLVLFKALQPDSVSIDSAGPGMRTLEFSEGGQSKGKGGQKGYAKGGRKGGKGGAFDVNGKGGRRESDRPVSPHSLKHRGFAAGDDARSGRGTGGNEDTGGRGRGRGTRGRD
eukprot:Hpha_TRINITY_DN10896_c0_g1::TRINITY_DN10896_c0_g1_i1::g.23065::m.23065